MKSDDKMDRIPFRQPLNKSDDLKEVIRLVATLTGEAKEAAEKNPLTSSGKPKSSLHGATVITNGLKEEGIEAHKRGLVPEPTMKGGLRNNDLNIAAKAALRSIEWYEKQKKELPEDAGQDEIDEIDEIEKK